MLIPERNRKMVYEYLFKEGAIVACSKVNGVKHQHLDVPNLQVIKLMTSLKSRDYVKESFSWRHYYWFLTNEGIQYLRDYLHLPTEIVPATLKRHTNREGAGRPHHRAVEEMSSRAAAVTEGREYRKTGSAFGGGYSDKMADTGAGHQDTFQFRGGYGRGQGKGAGGFEDRPRRGFGGPSEDRPRGAAFRDSSPVGRPRDSDYGATAPQYHNGDYIGETNGFYHGASQRESRGAGLREEGGHGAAAPRGYSKGEADAPHQRAPQFEEMWN